MIYCDTSFLVSLYIEDMNSESAQRRLENIGEPLVWTAWHKLEFCTALAARIGRGESSAQQVDAVHHRLADHRTPGGFFREPPVRWTEALSHAADIGRQHGATFGTRSLDVVHVALALQIGTVKFWTFDARQNSLATTLGLDPLETAPP